MHHPDYISIAEAADILGLTIRQARRYKTKVRSITVGRKLYLHREDITALLARKQAEVQAQRVHKQRPRAEEALLSYLREREAKWEATTERLQKQLLQAAHRIGELETQLAQRLLPHEASSLQQQLTDVQKEREQLALERTSLQQRYDNLEQLYTTVQQELTQLKKPWWKRIFRT